MSKSNHSPRRFEVYLVNLDPTVGAEIQKVRPCVVISPDEMNRPLKTVIIAPLTSTVRGYPSRVGLTFRRKRGEVVLDQMRAVDKVRLVEHWGAVDDKTAIKLGQVLVEMFTV
ncbi:type II toxin-antitoxin system PemK/MazF family toxin [Vampirovibrio sp.]|uniref:type II toxin-antitoxin system PemK/MazF family toxin n=1 Tax=Vampirovibrio sp. TaxID=2717857 RepID=UPI003593098A